MTAVRRATAARRLSVISVATILMGVGLGLVPTAARAGLSDCTNGPTLSDPTMEKCDAWLTSQVRGPIVPFDCFIQLTPQCQAELQGYATDDVTMAGGFDPSSGTLTPPFQSLAPPSGVDSPDTGSVLGLLPDESNPCVYRTAMSGSPVCARPLTWTGARVYIEDHSSSAWSTPAATNSWNAVGALQVTYTTACPANSNCVKVYSANYGGRLSPEAPHGWVGQSNLSYHPSSSTFASGFWIRLDDYFGAQMTGAQRRSVICQELGHALGLDHNSSRSSCMYADVQTGSVPQSPNGDDGVLLRRIYGQ